MIDCDFVMLTLSMFYWVFFFFFFFKQKTAYEMRISDWSSDVCSSDLVFVDRVLALKLGDQRAGAVDLQHHVMRLAVFRDLVREAAQAPGLGLDDLALIILDDLGGGLDRKSVVSGKSGSVSVDLGGGRIIKTNR